MKLQSTTIAACAAVLTLAAPAWAADGLLITGKTTANGSTTESQIQLTKDHLRMQTTGGNGPQVVTFDGTAQVVRMINDADKTYTELTKADVDRLSAQMSQMMAQMQEQMKNMPPEQRAQIEAMMRGRGAAMSPPPKTEYRKTGTAKVGAWTCTQYEGYQADKKVSELCTVSPSALGFTAADFEVTRQMADFFKSLVPPGMSNQEMFAIGDDATAGFSGVPVRMSTAGASPVVNEIQAVTRQNVPDSAFAVPAGYKKQALPMGGGR